MNLKLTRNEYAQNGIFSTLTTEAGTHVAETLEHAYPMLTSYEPKIPVGIYKCVRGEHRLHGKPPFGTFEVTGVAGHSGILFHAGNYNTDSDGCVLVGEKRFENMITNSKRTFAAFMALQDGLQEFILEIV